MVLLTLPVQEKLFANIKVALFQSQTEPKRDLLADLLSVRGYRIHPLCHVGEFRLKISGLMALQILTQHRI